MTLFWILLLFFVFGEINMILLQNSPIFLLWNNPTSFWPNFPDVLIKKLTAAFRETQILDEKSANATIENPIYTIDLRPPIILKYSSIKRLSILLYRGTLIWVAPVGILVGICIIVISIHISIGSIATIGAIRWAHRAISPHTTIWTPVWGIPRAITWIHKWSGDKILNIQGVWRQYKKSRIIKIFFLIIWR